MRRRPIPTDPATTRLLTKVKTRVTVEAMTETKPDPAHPPPARDFLSRRVHEVCDTCGQFIEYWGFKAIYGRLWALLAISAGPLTQTEIADTLNVSRSLISSSIAELTRLGLVRPTRVHRNAPYEAVMDVWPVISNVLRSREWMLIESVRMALEAAIQEAEYLEGKGRNHRYNLKSMRLLLSLTEMAQSFLKILMRMRLPQSTEGMSSWITMASRVIRQFGG